MVELLELSYIQHFYRFYKKQTEINRNRVQTFSRNLTETLHVLGEHTGMKQSCIKAMSKVRGLSIERRSSTGCID